MGGIDMKTIEERAKEFAQDFNLVSNDMDCGNCNTCSKCSRYRKFVNIVTEQREIDIEKAWSLAYSMYQAGRDNLIPLTKDEFRKTMEE